MIILNPFKVCAFEKQCEHTKLPWIDSMCGRVCQGLNPDRKNVFVCELHPVLDELKECGGVAQPLTKSCSGIF